MRPTDATIYEMGSQASSSRQPNSVSNEYFANRRNVTNNSSRNKNGLDVVGNSDPPLPLPTMINTELMDIAKFVNVFRTNPKDLPILFYERYNRPNPWNLWDDDAGLRTTPTILFYERYNRPNPWNLWDDDAGLRTTPTILGLPLDQDFFRNSIVKHLSLPLHEPWLFSPYISVTRNPRHINVSNPQALYRFDTQHSVLVINLARQSPLQKPWVYRVSDLVVALQLPPKIYEHREGWMDEYLVLQFIPRQSIGVITPGGFEKVFPVVVPTVPASPVFAHPIPVPSTPNTSNPYPNVFPVAVRTAPTSPPVSVSNNSPIVMTPTQPCLPPHHPGAIPFFTHQATVRSTTHDTSRSSN